MGQLPRVGHLGRREARLGREETQSALMGAAEAARALVVTGAKQGVSLAAEALQVRPKIRRQEAEAPSCDGCRALNPPRVGTDYGDGFC